MKLEDWVFKQGKSLGLVAQDLDISRAHLSIYLKTGKGFSPKIAEKIEEKTNGQVTRVEVIWPNYEGPYGK